MTTFAGVNELEQLADRCERELAVYQYWDGYRPHRVMTWRANRIKATTMLANVFVDMCITPQMACRIGRFKVTALYWPKLFSGITINAIGNGLFELNGAAYYPDTNYIDFTFSMKIKVTQDMVDLEFP